MQSRLHESKNRLEDLLGAPVRELAYPFGAVNAAVRRMAAECGYETARTVEKGLASAADDPLLLPRVHVRGSDSRADLICGLHSGRGVREQVGVTIARLRRAVLATIDRHDRPAS